MHGSKGGSRGAGLLPDGRSSAERGRSHRDILMGGVVNWVLNDIVVLVLLFCSAGIGHAAKVEIEIGAEQLSDSPEWGWTP